MVCELHHVVATPQRLKTIQSILDRLGYHPVSKSCQHFNIAEKLVEHGALHALSLQLGFVLNKGLDSESEELNKICALVHVLCQCSERVRGEAMQQIGRDIHELLVRAFEHANTEGKVNKDTIHSILCIWHILASNEEGAISLLQCRGLVGTIIQVLNTGPDSAEIENEAIGIIKQVTGGWD